VKALAPAAPRQATPRPAAIPGTQPAAATPAGSTAQALAALAAAALPDPLRATGALPAFDINSVSISQVAAMEVYPEGAPPQLFYGGNAKCGVVLLWSKAK
jgi:hypothetical protein